MCVRTIDGKAKVASIYPREKRCTCGATYHKHTWHALPCIGRMDYFIDGDDKLELRNCTCGSTIAVEIMGS